jgi:hypothetical protein
LELRRRSDPHGVPVNLALASVYGLLGLGSLEAQALARAADTRRRHLPQGTRASIQARPVLPIDDVP